MGQLKKVVNIGSVSEKQLEQVGIVTLEQLKEIGSKNAFLQIKMLDPDACICKLYALQGAIEEVRWHYLPQATKDELLEFYNSL